MWSVHTVKGLHSRTATNSIPKINEHLKISWDESKYLPFEVFQSFVKEKVYMFLLEPVLEQTKVVVVEGKRSRVTDLLLTVWEDVAIVLENTFLYEPDVSAFQESCERIRVIGQKLEWVATVWPHCVLCHFGDFLDEQLGTLAPLDNRNLEHFHPEVTEHCQHRRVTGGRTGWEHCLGEDNQKLHYLIEDLVKGED